MPERLNGKNMISNYSTIIEQNSQIKTHIIRLYIILHNCKSLPSIWDVRVTNPSAVRYIHWFCPSSSSLSIGVVTCTRPGNEKIHLITTTETNDSIRSNLQQVQHSQDTYPTRTFYLSDIYWSTKQDKTRAYLAIFALQPSFRFTHVEWGVFHPDKMKRAV